MGGKSVTIRCAECDTEFSRKPSQLSGEKDYYCSLQCAGEGYRKKHSGENSVHFNSREIECDYCGKALVRRASHVRARNFCSRSCLHKWRVENLAGADSPHYDRIETSCRQCGTEFTITPARLNEAGNFCTHECYSVWRSQTLRGPQNPLWKGGALPYYGPNWQQQRHQARKRDGYKCQHCGITEKALRRQLDVHHIVPFRSFGYIQDENDNYKEANKLSNLISFCHECHLKAENGHIPIRPKLL